MIPENHCQNEGARKNANVAKKKKPNFKTSLTRSLGRNGTILLVAAADPAPVAAAVAAWPARDRAFASAA